VKIDNVPFVQKLMQNPAYTDFWSLQAVDKWMAAHPLTVPTMLEVGEWDQEDSYGAPAVYRALKDKYEGTPLLHLVIGPWRHSGANHYGYDLGALTLAAPVLRFPLAGLQATLEVDLFALAQIFLGQVSQLVECDDVVPFGLLAGTPFKGRRD